MDELSLGNLFIVAAHNGVEKELANEIICKLIKEVNKFKNEDISEDTMENKIYFTIAGIRFRFGNDIFEKGMEVYLKKDPENEYDSEAIEVRLPGLGIVGMVANSWKTVLGECYSAGRLYDKIGDEATGKVMYVTNSGIVCELCS